MQLTSIPPANVTGSGPVTRSSTPPGIMSGRGPSTSPTPAPVPSASNNPTAGTDPAARGQTTPEPRSPAPASNTSNSGARGRSDNRVDQSSSERRPARPPEKEGGTESREGSPENRPGTEGSQGQDDVSPEMDSLVNELRARDREVRQHEQAHQTVGGQYAGAPTYDYSRGPEGQLYATGGQVSIDTSAVSDDPRATINKMQTVRAAALAPANPSPQDIQVAQEATSKMLAAQAELRAEQREEVRASDDSAESGSGSGSGPESGGSDSRIALFQDIDGFSDPGSQSEASPRFEAIA